MREVSALLGAWNIRSPDYVAQPEIAFEDTARRYEPGALNLLALLDVQHADGRTL